MTGPNQTPPKRGTVEHLDDLLYVIRNDENGILDAGVEEFAELERVAPRNLKLTLRGENETKPLVLMLEAETPILIRELGHKARPVPT